MSRIFLWVLVSGIIILILVPLYAPLSVWLQTGAWSVESGFPDYYGPKDLVTGQPFERGITSWDYLQLIAVPVALIIVASIVARVAKQSEIEAAEEQSNNDALQAYYKDIGKIIIENNLDDANSERVKKLVENRTAFAMLLLDGKRRASVVKLLYDMGLIKQHDGPHGNILPLISLSQCDLSGVDFEGKKRERVNLDRVILNGADLSKANFSHCDLVKAQLITTNLEGANLSHANLNGADLIGSTMEGANTNDVMQDEDTNWPDGFRPTRRQL